MPAACQPGMRAVLPVPLVMTPAIMAFMFVTISGLSTRSGLSVLAWYSTLPEAVVTLVTTCGATLKPPFMKVA